MAAAKSRKGILDEYSTAPSLVQNYFAYLPGLLGGFPLDVCLSYAFSQVEVAHNMTLYCGVVRLHRANSQLARTAIDTHHMTRKDFKEKFKTVFGQDIPDKVSSKLTAAEDVRDKVMHGKSATAKEKRETLANVIEYAVAFNSLVSGIASFRPFGDLRGFKGRAQSLDKSTTRWVLKGMGFSIS